jgi:hypothetical protein
MENRGVQYVDMPQQVLLRLLDPGYGLGRYPFIGLRSAQGAASGVDPGF